MKPFQIHPSLTTRWALEIKHGDDAFIAETIDLCQRQRRGWMVSARECKAAGSRPVTYVNMAWKYHRRLLMLLRAKKAATVPTQAALF